MQRRARRGRGLWSPRGARFANQRSSFNWSGKGLKGRRLADGYYVARLSIAFDPRLAPDVRQIALVRRHGKFRLRPPFEHNHSRWRTVLLQASGPVFGGRTRRALGVAYRLAAPARVSIEGSGRFAAIAVARGLLAGHSA